MTDINVYYLAQTARTKLSHEASSDDQNLRRILGHANMLDHLTAELFNQGYTLNDDEGCIEDDKTCAECIEDVLMASNEPLCHSSWADPVMSGARNDVDTESSESEDSEDSNDEESCDAPDLYSSECLECGGSDDCSCVEDGIASLRQNTVRVSVQEISEFD
jgi:hypothetical protein